MMIIISNDLGGDFPSGYEALLCGVVKVDQGVWVKLDFGLYNNYKKPATNDIHKRFIHLCVKPLQN